MKIKKSLNIFGQMVSLETPVVMGILNVTPDSFFEGSRHQSEKTLLDKAEVMLTDGATFLDVGGYSSRPGAAEVSEEDELKRVIPAVRAIMKEFPHALLSVDTFRSEVANRALDAGAAIINDISGGQLDENMYTVVSKWKCPYILMHMKGTPQNMMDSAEYANLLVEILEYFSEKISLLRKKGVADIIIDPGFGFAKNITQNYKLLKDLSHLKVLGLPILAGISRKSMIYKKLEINSQEALNGTTVLNSFALMNGASILRVHDVKEASEAICLYKEMIKD
ncbi:MAG: dihydropteroate synthase [Cyclobacteriaceae bacterium]